ncbi:MAG: response regulator [Candidatus Krumholzibacteria bacterium]|nr:response regulator [Candidatus Krumholzibacteria bacterium]
MALKILVVDDEVDLARILQLTLESAGYEVILAYDGEEALRMALLEHPALVILDLMLPVIDGARVCSILRKDERTKSMPVIILSARNLEFERFDEPIAASLFIEKPFDSKMLLERVSGLLNCASHSKGIPPVKAAE